MWPRGQWWHGMLAGRLWTFAQGAKWRGDPVTCENQDIKMALIPKAR
jgi:hypothetical protein